MIFLLFQLISVKLSVCCRRLSTSAIAAKALIKFIGQIFISCNANQSMATQQMEFAQAIR